MGRQSQGRRRALMAAAAIVSAGLGGCINIAAPDEPIVIELNINIRQEVIYRLAEDAANTIDENADIF
ncbi:MAG: YnbE family lipoprotein [Sphingomonadales bacterium]|nr:YnbE family lipoprotein [Sphingomonadales bacterium]NCQ21274.1 YnbE family lipoprotein [Sphingomonadales bacterium]NCT03438.1 YnbE family lipoprotein [Sphingomonadales bacterium]